MAPSTCRSPTPRSTRSSCPQQPRSSTRSMPSRWPIVASMPFVVGSRPNRLGIAAAATIPLSSRRVLFMGEERLDDQATARLASLLELGNPGAEWPMRIGSKKGSVTSMPGLIPPRAAGGSQSSTPSVSNAPMPREIQRVGRTIRTCFGKLGLPVGDYLRSRPPQPPLLDAQRDAVHDADVHAGLVADERR